ncbi:YqgQ family protein [Bacillus cereus]|uniref:Cytoplasmic protein n=1 Tax=Bacillus cereus TaxID=1396 RepID=A0A2C1M568_BACCE|nr:YqgQ family protein [Bacillus cereus]PGU05853.1 cytoplasmic protein [Bacillus cereus]
MVSIYDIQQLLKKFGTIIYTGDRIADLQLMQDELRELNQSQLIDPQDYQTALFLLKQEIPKELNKN